MPELIHLLKSTRLWKIGLFSAIESFSPERFELNIYLPNWFVKLAFLYTATAKEQRGQTTATFSTTTHTSVVLLFFPRSSQFSSTYFQSLFVLIMTLFLSGPSRTKSGSNHNLSWAQRHCAHERTEEADLNEDRANIKGSSFTVHRYPRWYWDYHHHHPFWEIIR